MDVSREELATRFRDLSDDELAGRVRAGALTPVALEVATSELRSRGIEPPSNMSDSGETSDPIIAGETDLITVAVSWNPLEANLLRGLLESAGVDVHMWGEHLGTTHLFMSVASGGMRLQVPPDQVAHAKEVLAAYERGDFAMKEDQ